MDVDVGQRTRKVAERQPEFFWPNGSIQLWQQKHPPDIHTFFGVEQWTPQETCGNADPANPFIYGHENPR